MQVALIEDKIFDGTQLLPGYFLAKYLGKKQDEFLFYWKNDLNLNPRNLLDLNIISFYPSEQIEVIVEKNVTHIVLQLLNREALTCTLLKEWLLSSLNKETNSNTFYSFHVSSSNPLFYIGVKDTDIKIVETCILQWISKVERAYNNTYFSLFEEEKRIQNVSYP